MKIALIITTYNRPDALHLVLQSAARQTVLPHQIIIADDGSDTNTQTLIAQHQSTAKVPIVHVWQKDEGFQVAAIRNKAVAATAADYLIFVDGDMVLHPFFIENHCKACQKNTFIQGSRALLNHTLTQKAIAENLLQFAWFTAGLSNRFNAMQIPFLSKYVSPKVKHLKGIRTCNFAVWRTHFIAVNGFNQDFTGWGWEDSELAARLLHNKVQRKNLKFAALAYHLNHHNNHQNQTSQQQLQHNQQLLQNTLAQQKTWCANGIDQYL